MSMPNLDDIMHIHLIAFRSQFVDEVTVERSCDGYHYVGTELKFFEHEMGCHEEWKTQVCSIIHSMTLRSTVNGQAYCKVYSLKINIDEQNMRETLETDPRIVEGWCKEYGQRISG